MTLFFLALFGGLIHVANSEVRSFERGASMEIASRLEDEGKRVEVKATIGPEALWGDVYRVEIDASKFATDGLPFFVEPRRSKVGVLRTLQIDLYDLTLSGLHVETLTATVPNCRFDFAAAVKHREFRLTRSGTGTGEVTVSADDLKGFIMRKYPAIREATVTIDRDKVILSGVGEFFFAKATFTVIGRIETEDGVRLNLTHSRMILGDKVLDEKARESIIGRLNPVLDLDKDLHLHGAVRLTSIEARDGNLTGRGEVHIPDLPVG